MSANSSITPTIPIPSPTTSFQELVEREKIAISSTPTVAALRKVFFDVIDALQPVLLALSTENEALRETLARVSHSPPSESVLSAVVADEQAQDMEFSLNNASAGTTALSSKLATLETDVRMQAQALDASNDKLISLEFDILNTLTDKINILDQSVLQQVTDLESLTAKHDALQLSLETMDFASAATVPTIPTFVHRSGAVEWSTTCESLPDGVTTCTTVKIKHEALYSTLKKLFLGSVTTVGAPDPAAVRVFIPEYLRLVKAIAEGHSDDEKNYLYANELHIRHRMHADLYPILGDTAVMEMKLPESTVATGQLIVDYLWSVAKLTSQYLVTESALDAALNKLTFDPANRNVTLAIQTYKALFKKVLEEHSVYHIMLSNSVSTQKQREHYMSLFLSKMRAPILNRLKADAMFEPRLLVDFAVAIPALIKYITEDNIAYDARAVAKPSRGTPSGKDSVKHHNHGKSTGDRPKSGNGSDTTPKRRDPPLRGKEGHYMIHACKTEAAKNEFYALTSAQRIPIMDKYYNELDKAKESKQGGEKKTT